MPTDQDFLQAIAENPSDPFYRGVYADWLAEERGKEQLADWLRAAVPAMNSQIERVPGEFAHEPIERFEFWDRRYRVRGYLFEPIKLSEPVDSSIGLLYR